jgi:hypothetical protein
VSRPTNDLSCDFSTYPEVSTGAEAWRAARSRRVKCRRGQARFQSNASLSSLTWDLVSFAASYPAPVLALAYRFRGRRAHRISVSACCGCRDLIGETRRAQETSAWTPPRLRDGTTSVGPTPLTLAPACWFVVAEPAGLKCNAIVQGLMKASEPDVSRISSEPGVGGSEGLGVRPALAPAAGDPGGAPAARTSVEYRPQYRAAGRLPIWRNGGKIASRARR